MAADYKLSLDGDLDLSTAAYEIVEDAAQTRQAVSIGLQIDRGEWFENVEAGVPWLSTILSQRGTKDFMDAFLVAYIAAFDDVVEVTEYVSTIDSSQTAQIKFTAIANTNESFSLSVEI